MTNKELYIVTSIYLFSIVYSILFDIIANAKDKEKINIEEILKSLYLCCIPVFNTGFIIYTLINLMLELWNYSVHRARNDFTKDG